MGKIKVVVAEDSASARELLVSILSADPQLKVIGQARDGEEAVALVARLRPDVVTMDIVMPGMGGLEATRRIMASNPVPIVIVSASWKALEVKSTFETIRAGALAVLSKPSGPGSPDFERSAERLRRTVVAMSQVKVVTHRPAGSERPSTPERSSRDPGAPSLSVVAIGASTGGPEALRELLTLLPKELPVPVLVAQHLSAGFLDGLLSWLAESTGQRVERAVAGQSPLPGRIYFAPEEEHLELSPSGRLVLTPAGDQDLLCPSADRLLSSVALVHGPRAAGVVLTGMGKDGAQGLKAMHDRGALTFAQDKPSSVVYGMPGEALRLGAATYVLPPRLIAHLLEQTLAGA